MERTIPWLSSIRNKLTLLFLAVTAIAVLIVYFYVIPQLQSNLTARKIEALKRDGHTYVAPFNRAVRTDASIPYLESLTNRVSQLAGSRVTLYRVVDTTSSETGRPVLSSTRLTDSRDVGTKVQPSTTVVLSAARDRRVATSSRSGGQRLAQVAEPVNYEKGVPWVVVFSEPLGDVEDSVALIRRQVLIAGSIALIVAALVGYFFSTVLARRVKRLERAAAGVAAGNLSTPIPIDSEDELGQLGRAFNEMQRQLRRVDDARKEFIANASHELRTPIFSLGGFVELLQDEDIDEQTREEFLHTMREQVERLQKLTTDLLDLSKLDAGSLELELEPVSLRMLAKDVASEFVAAAELHGSAIEVGAGDGSEAEASCDPLRVEQILRVLLNNAITHTPEGTEVEVSARETTDPGGRATATLSVTDNGPGISSADLEHVFERFHSGNAAQGSGLGLAIARELAQRMQGRLDVTSSPEGTTFTLSLPRAGEWTPPSATPAKSGQRETAKSSRHGSAAHEAARSRGADRRARHGRDRVRLGQLVLQRHEHRQRRQHAHGRAHQGPGRAGHRQERLQPGGDLRPPLGRRRHRDLAVRRRQGSQRPQGRRHPDRARQRLRARRAGATSPPTLTSSPTAPARTSSRPRRSTCNSPTPTRCRPRSSASTPTPTSRC